MAGSNEWDLPDLAALVLFLLVLAITELKPLLFKSHGLLHLQHHAVGPPPGRQKESHRPLTVSDVPGPRPLPIIGTRWIYYHRYRLEKLHEAQQDMFLRYGAVVKEEALWNFPVVSLYDRGDIERVLRLPGKYPFRPPTEVTAHYRLSRPDRYPSLGLINEQGETWHTLRSHLTPELTSAKTMSLFFPELLSITEDFIRYLKTSKDQKGDISAFDELACHLGLESTCSLILGKRMGVFDDKASEVSLKLAEAVKEQFLASRDTYFGLPFWKFFPTPAYKRFIKAEETIYDLISDMVENARVLEDETYKENSPSVFQSILRTPGLDIREKKAGIIDFIAAGIKTLGNTLVFLLYLMAKNKDCQEKLLEEINSLTNGHELTLQNIGKAQYLKACITEAYRLLPTAPCIARILESDMDFQGYNLKAGSVVLCQTWQACLREDYFPRAKEFLPERWLKSEKMPWLVTPFGAGRRVCPGKRFVELELQVLLAEIVRQFKIDFEGEIDIQFEFLMAPKSPTSLRLTERI